MFLRQRAVVGADEGDAPARRGAGDDVEQRNAGSVEAEDGVVDRGLVHRHEHRRVGPLRDGSRNQRDLLRHAVGLFGDIVDGGGAEPRRGPVRAQPRGLIGRIGPVFGEDRDAGHVRGLQMASRAILCGKRRNLSPRAEPIRAARPLSPEQPGGDHAHETIPESGADQGPPRRHDRPRRRHRLCRQGGADESARPSIRTSTSIG